MLVIEARDGEAMIDVVDDGPGIPTERRDAVFRRFHREATGLGDGFGVGLSIVQRVAQLHGAVVSLDDAPWGRGLRVRVRLPLAVRTVQDA
jgi:two-component system sensor histidine kinase QseC